MGGAIQQDVGALFLPARIPNNELNNLSLIFSYMAKSTLFLIQ